MRFRYPDLDNNFYNVTIEGHTQSQKDALWTHYQQSLSTLRQMILAKATLEDSAWTAMDSIQTIECLDSISMIEMKALKYLSKIDSLTEAEKIEIDLYSRKCAQKYGRGIHIMRSIAAHFNDEDYREFDIACDPMNYQSPPNSVLTNTNNWVESSDIEIVPNPNSGSFNLIINTDNEIQDILIFDLQGRMINRYKNIDSNIIFRDMASGIYFLKINFVTSEYLVKTIIVE